MVAKDNLDMAQRQKATEGLRELACMIAVAYQRRSTDKTVQSLTANEDNVIGEAEIIASVEPADSHTGYVYAETVKVANFMRKKVPGLSVWQKEVRYG